MMNTMVNICNVISHVMPHYCLTYKIHSILLSVHKFRNCTQIFNSNIHATSPYVHMKYYIQYVAEHFFLQGKYTFYKKFKDGEVNCRF